MIGKVLSPGGSLRLLASSLPGLQRLLVDEEDLQLVKMMMKNLKMVKLDMQPATINDDHCNDRE